MRLISVTERELRAAARQKARYHLRWIMAALALGFLLWLGWVFNLSINRGAVPQVFHTFAATLYVYCLFMGATATADCLSRERREGTLGLLFLTNLNSTEIMAGKLAANGLSLLYSLVAIFPILALPVMLGGITLGEFGRSVLALMSGLFFAVAMGFAASSVCVRQFPAVALATGLTLLFGLVPMLAVQALLQLRAPRALCDWIAAVCPLNTLLVAAEFFPKRGPNSFWSSLGLVTVFSGLLLLLVTIQLGRSWRDRPKRKWSWGFSRTPRATVPNVRPAGAALRRRLLEINPFFWLAARKRISAPIITVLVVLMILATQFLGAPFFSRVMRGMASGGDVFGHTFAWLWGGLAIHALLLYYAATIASQRLAEDKQSGALELILSAPGTERFMSRGLWLAYARRMSVPALLATLVHCYFIWQVLNLMLLDPPGGALPTGATAGSLYWCSILGLPLNGQQLGWEVSMILRTVTGIWFIFAANWVMLGWLGRWLGLRMKHPGFAPMVACAMAVALPIFLFTLTMFVLDKIRFLRMPDEITVPIVATAPLVIVLGNCILWSVWAARQLRTRLRTTVTSRYEGVVPGQWWRTTRLIARRLAIATVSFVLLIILIAGSFYGYQSWRAKRDWARFQKELKQRNESLDLASVAPAAAPADQNFALAPAFQALLTPSPTNVPVLSLLKNLSDPAEITTAASTFDWTKQTHSGLDVALKKMAPRSRSTDLQNRQKVATLVKEGLHPLETPLDEITQASHLEYFQIATNLTFRNFNDDEAAPFLLMEQLHYLLNLRALALLTLDRGAAAATDVQTSLRLTALVSQSQDTKSQLRLEVQLMRSLQAIWEGLADHRWREPELRAIQAELRRFDLLAHFTNAVNTAVLTHVSRWTVLPDGDPQEAIAVRNSSDWQWQPKTVWYDYCIQLHKAGRDVISRVDVVAGRVSTEYRWVNMNNLPLDQYTTRLLQQGPWWGNTTVTTSFAQNAVNQAIIACALERFREARGGYPGELAELTPQLLETIPVDTCRGRPMDYRKLPTGDYELRGAGFDGAVNQEPTLGDDWLWAFQTPTNKPPAAVRGKKP